MYFNEQPNNLDNPNDLLPIFKNTPPETKESSTEISAELKSKVAIKEHIINDLEIIKLLKEYNINPQEIGLKENIDGTFSLSVTKHFNTDELPAGYLYKGGAARSLLLRTLNIDPQSQPRDIDICRFGIENPDTKLDESLARKYMPDDFKNGKGVEEIESIKEYFETRDFTINEILASDNTISLTRQCLSDTIRHIIRLTKYEEERYNNTSHKMLAKALRLYTENIHKYGNAKLENIDDYKLENYFIAPFWLAVNLDRAYQRGKIFAQEYIDELISRGQLPNYIINPEIAANYLLDLMYDSTNFYYRYAPQKQFEIEDKLAEDYELDELDALPKFESHHKYKK